LFDPDDDMADDVFQPCVTGMGALPSFAATAAAAGSRRLDFWAAPPRWIYGTRNAFRIP
jgi:hypothetical protein